MHQNHLMSFTVETQFFTLLIKNPCLRTSWYAIFFGMNECLK